MLFLKGLCTWYDIHCTLLSAHYVSCSQLKCILLIGALVVCFPGLWSKNSKEQIMADFSFFLSKHPLSNQRARVAFCFLSSKFTYLFCYNTNNFHICPPLEKPALNVTAAEKTTHPARTLRMTIKWADCWRTPSTPTWLPKWKVETAWESTSATAWSSPTLWCLAKTPPSTQSPMTGLHLAWLRNWWEIIGRCHIATANPFRNLRSVNFPKNPSRTSFYECIILLSYMVSLHRVSSKRPARCVT